MSQRRADPPVAVVLAHDQCDVTDMLLPPGQLPDVGIAHDRRTVDRDDLPPVAGLDRVDQPGDRGGRLQLYVEIEPIVLGQLGAEGQQRVQVILTQPADAYQFRRGHRTPPGSRTESRSSASTNRLNTASGSPRPSTSSSRPSVR